MDGKRIDMHCDKCCFRIKCSTTLKSYQINQQAAAIGETFQKNCYRCVYCRAPERYQTGDANMLQPPISSTHPPSNSSGNSNGYGAQAAQGRVQNKGSKFLDQLSFPTSTPIDAANCAEGGCCNKNRLDRHFCNRVSFLDVHSLSHGGSDRISSVLRTTHKCVGRGGVKKRDPIGMTGIIHSNCQCQTLAHGFTKRPVGLGRVVLCRPGRVRPGPPSYLKMRSSRCVSFVGLGLEQMPWAFGSSLTSTREVDLSL